MKGYKGRVPAPLGKCAVVEMVKKVNEYAQYLSLTAISATGQLISKTLTPATF